MSLLRSRSWGVAAVIGALSVLGFPALAHAGCGGTDISHPAHPPRGQLPPLAIGDSTMLLSLPGLAAEGFEANAHGCRQYFQALDMLKQLRAVGKLPRMVVIALGANGSVTGADIGETLGVLGPRRLLVLVTPRELGGGSGADAATERSEARRHPRRIELLDWVAHSAGHSNWFDPDGLHLMPPGVQAFTAFLGTAFEYAYAPRPTLARADRRFHAATVRPSDAPISLRVSTRRTGYIAATIRGPAGAEVQLSEQLATRRTPLGGPVQLPASGQLTIPRAATWLCTRRSRSFVASTLPPAPAGTVTAAVKTPSCAHRLEVRISRRAHVGGSINVRLTDQWGTGGLPIRLCFAPPGAPASCRMASLASAQAGRELSLSTPRIGGWNVRIVTPYGQRFERRIWASHPGAIRAQLDGDSEMQILDDFIGANLKPLGVRSASDARQSTGLTNSIFYNWQTAAHRQAATFRPDVSIVIIGANDGFSTSGPGGAHENCCGAAWSTGYAHLVAEMMRTLLRGDSGRVYWVLLPTPRPGNFKDLFDGVNRGIKAAAAQFPGRVGLIDASAFFTPGNRYRDFMTYHGSGFTIHESDGIHLGTAADHVLAGLILDRLRADHVIH
jgi:lysophospholipase L1-like esterase